MPHLAFGTAQLYGLAEPARSELLMAAAWKAGIRRFDTAPSYGAGRSEERLGAFLAGREGVEAITTKVGLAPKPGPAALRAVVKRLLPSGLRERARSAATQAVHGRFEESEVRASVEESLRRLDGRIDRLLLHEVRPADITNELRTLLTGLLAAGDVGAVGVATANELTAECLGRAPELFSVAHVAVGPLSAVPELPDGVSVRVGHGLLGTGGAQARRLDEVLGADRGAADAWVGCTSGTAFEGSGGLARALIARGAGLALTDLLIASTKPERVAETVELLQAGPALPVAAAELLDRLVGQVRAADAAAPA